MKKVRYKKEYNRKEDLLEILPSEIIILIMGKLNLNDLKNFLIIYMINNRNNIYYNDLCKSINDNIINKNPIRKILEKYLSLDDSFIKFKYFLYKQSSYNLFKIKLPYNRSHSRLIYTFLIKNYCNICNNGFGLTEIGTKFKGNTFYYCKSCAKELNMTYYI